ncbi:hypothetical protein FHS42_002401 [Streptomyces zagrosensis]|uniref:Uncharacterized protein n=1 Tax=Streptomyces zagrosensis TaxID=1042984 RepID=A0A7W9UZ27_9ACTN|nr:hypothetical protein [Streptomyces zagrosensis]
MTTVGTAGRSTLRLLPYAVTAFAYRRRGLAFSIVLG